MIRIAAALLVTALSAGCAIYRMDIAQGNVVTQEMLDQLKIGMSRSQVRYVLGTPLIADPFHSDRWDYYYSLRKGKENRTDTRRVTVLFKDDALIGIDGNVDTSAGAADRTASIP